VVSYAQQTFKSRNPIARFSHRSRLEAGLSAVAEHLPPSGTLLDFGCGPGVFLEEIKAHRPDAVLYGYDPFVKAASPVFDRVDDLDKVRPGSVDLICAFEVLEHMTRDGWHDFTRFCQAALSKNPKARVVVSVPIMLGPVLLVKTLNSYIFKRKDAEYSLVDLIASSIFHRGVERAEQPVHSHKGFDFRRLKQFLGMRFEVENEFFSPYRKLYYGLNSQYFVTLRLADDGAGLAV
jgi:cyclopropane fatty-acyl-phospholipid synthase-like methyltransferase